MGSESEASTGGVQQVGPAEIRALFRKPNFRRENARTYSYILIMQIRCSASYRMLRRHVY
jgi:hypothetical protein